MLADQKLKAFVPTTKPKEAKDFYTKIIGLTLLSEDEYALEFEASGILLRVITVPELNPQGFTVLGWNVADIYEIIKSLNVNGIECNKYDFFEQDSFGVWKSPGGSKVAWFNDPDGNVLSITE